MKKILSSEYILTPAVCDEITEKVFDFLLKKVKCAKKEALKIKYSLDSILLGLLDLEEEIEVKLSIIKRMGRYEVSLSYSTNDEKSYNPIEQDFDGEIDANGVGDSYFKLISESMGGIWNHEYENGVNTLSVTVKKYVMSGTTQTVLSIVASLITVLLMRLFLPAETQNFILENVINIFIDKYIIFLKAFVSFMVFVSIVCGIVKLGNPNKISTIGMSVIRRISFVTVTAVTAAAVLSVFLFSNVALSASGTLNGADRLLAIIYDIIPSDLISPFQDGNFIQILLIAVIIGTVMLGIRRKVPAAEKLFEDLNAILTKVISGMGDLLHLFIYMSVLHIGLSSTLKELRPFFRAFAFDVVLFAFIVLIEILRTSRKTKKPFVFAFKKLIKVFIVGFTTCSGAACFSTIKETTDEAFKVRPSFSQFSVPMMLSLFKTGVAVSFFILTRACAEYSGVSVSVTNIIVLAVCASILSHASPPVPGGTLSCYPILFVQLGLPLELIAIVSAINPFFDMIETGTSMLCIAAETVGAAVSNKLITEKKKTKVL